MLAFMHSVIGAAIDITCSDAKLDDCVKHNVSETFFNIAMFLVPAMVGFAALHKVMDHQTNLAGFATDVLVKGGGAVVVLLLVKSLVGGFV